MALVNCEECKQVISTKAETCVHCGAPISDIIKNKNRQLDNNQKKVIAEYTYSMFDAGPGWIALFVLLSITGIGIIFLLLWFLIMLPRPRLIITDRSLIYKDSHFKRHSINFYEIDNITIGCGPFQKICKTGWLKIHKKDFFTLPLFINGLPEPKNIKKLILDHKN